MNSEYNTASLVRGRSPERDQQESRETAEIKEIERETSAAPSVLVRYRVRPGFMVGVRIDKDRGPERTRRTLAKAEAHPATCFEGISPPPH
jgi:hypothetical protein